MSNSETVEYENELSERRLDALMYVSLLNEEDLDFFLEEVKEFRANAIEKKVPTINAHIKKVSIKTNSRMYANNMYLNPIVGREKGTIEVELSDNIIFKGQLSGWSWEQPTDGNSDTNSIRSK